MIVVANTKELEEEFDLSKIRDDELIRVEGGLKGKSKYNANQYVSRTTYTAKTLKQIKNTLKTKYYGLFLFRYIGKCKE